MRQEWINDLRELVAELTSSALHYFTAGHESEFELCTPPATVIPSPWRVAVMVPSATQRPLRLRMLALVRPSVWS